MGTITLQNFRVGGTVRARVRLKDGGVYVDWGTLTEIKAWLYSVDQKSMSGRFDVKVDPQDGTRLLCVYSAQKPQYLGVNKIIVQAKYDEQAKAYDKPLLNFVRWTADQANEEITMEDPEVDVEIVAEDMSSSVLDEATAAALAAADRAEAAAKAAEHMVEIHRGPAGKSPYKGENGNWFEWDEETGQYVDTGTKAKGETGATPNISIGTVTTVEPGTPAGATMGGTPEAPVLNLDLPKGAVGTTPNFTIGTVTTGEPGTPVVVTITGTAEAPVLNITIPQGMQGNSGYQGAAGELEVVNNLTDGGATAALSAEMGKTLNGKVTQLQEKVDYGQGVLSLINGGWNTAGEKAVSCEKVVSLTGKSRVFFMTNRPNTPGYHYEYYGMQYNVGSGNTADYRGNSSVRVSNPNGTLKGNILNSSKANDFIPDNGAVGFVFSIIERNESGTINNSLSASSFDGYVTWLEFATDSDRTIVRDAYSQDVVARNLDRMSMLKSAIVWGGPSGGGMGPQFEIIADIHRTQETLQDAINLANGFQTITAVLCCGDIVGSYFREANSFVPVYNETVLKCDKPVLTVIGNHDTGYFNAISACGDHKEMYDSFIKPMVDKGWLSAGEYQENKPYWYHDFTNRACRVIGLYEYDMPLDVDDTYWDAIGYDSSKPNVALNTAYSIGDIVNCEGYTGYSFRCKSNLTTPSAWTDTSKKFPSYKLSRGNRLIRQEQAQWFLDTLYGTPNNYIVIVLMHEPFSALSRNINTYKFAQANQVVGGNGYMQTDFIANAVNAFINKQNYSEKVKMATTGLSAAAYLNTEGEEGDKYYYQVSKDFSSRGTSTFRCYIGGHIHRDLIFKHDNYTQYQIDVACTKPDSLSDITTFNENDLCRETITVLTASRSANTAALVKLGANVTRNMTYRDMELIDLSQ